MICQMLCFPSAIRADPIIPEAKTIATNIHIGFIPYLNERAKKVPVSPPIEAMCKLIFQENETSNNRIITITDAIRKILNTGKALNLLRNKYPM